MHIPKKIIVAALLFARLLASLAADTDEFYLPDVEERYIGTYIPVDLENQLKKTRLFYEALYSAHRFRHAVLYLGKNVCYSDMGFHDGYAIRADEFADFRFVTNSAGTFCIDNRGNSYRKISGWVSSFGFEAYVEHVMKLILGAASDQTGVQIADASLVLGGKSYRVILDGTFFTTTNVAIWLSGDDGAYALIKNGVNGELHKGARQKGFHVMYPLAECIQEFPQMFAPIGAESYVR